MLSSENGIAIDNLANIMSSNRHHFSCAHLLGEDTAWRLERVLTNDERLRLERTDLDRLIGF